MTVAPVARFLGPDDPGVPSHGRAFVMGDMFLPPRCRLRLVPCVCSGVYPAELTCLVIPADVGTPRRRRLYW